MHEIVSLIDDVIQKEMKRVDKYIKQHIDPIADIGSPAKVIGKPFEEWSQQDMEKLGQTYSYDREKLERYIFDKEYRDILALEQKVADNA